jgi:hypothetical protein
LTYLIGNRLVYWRWFDCTELKSLVMKDSCLDTPPSLFDNSMEAALSSCPHKILSAAACARKMFPYLYRQTRLKPGIGLAFCFAGGAAANVI